MWLTCNSYHVNSLKYKFRIGIICKCIKGFKFNDKCSVKIYQNKSKYFTVQYNILKEQGIL